MRTIIVMVFTGLSLYYLSCNGNSNAAENNSLSSLLFPDDNNSFIAQPGNDIVLSNGADLSEFKTDAVNIDTAYITNDSVSFNVDYGGGCKEHRFSLLAASYFLESFPVQVNILLSHDSNDDKCKALVTKTGIKFNLAPIKNEYRKSYGSGGSTMILNIFTGNKQDRAVQLTYNFR
jgi:hypothetical protein